MKKYFIYARPVCNIRFYVGYVECDSMEIKMGLHIFYVGGKIVATFVADHVEIEDRTEPET